MPQKDNLQDTWTEYRQLVLSELNRLSDSASELKKEHDKFLLETSVSVGRLKIWAAITGAISGTIATLLIREVLHRWP